LIKVVSLIPSLHFGGDENRLLIFGANVDKSQFEHHVLLLRPPTDEMDAQRGSLRAAYAEKGVDIEVVRTKGDDNLAGRNGPAIRKLRLVREVAKLLRAQRADIVDARMNYAIGIGVAAARLASVPVTVGTTYRHGAGVDTRSRCTRQRFSIYNRWLSALAAQATSGSPCDPEWYPDPDGHSVQGRYACLLRHSCRAYALRHRPDKQIDAF